MEEHVATTKNRIEWVDAAKGLLIVLVVLGHSTSIVWIKNWISAFYMSAFFILSGFTMRKELKMPLWKYIANRAIQLLGPYLLFSIAWIGFSYIKDMLSPSGFSISSAIVSIFLPYSGRLGGSVYNYWFLPCMFLAQVAFFLCLYPQGWKKSIGAVLWLLYLVVGIALGNYGSLLICAVVSAVFIAIGFIVKRLTSGGGYTFSKKSIWIAIAAICVYIGATWLNCDYLDNVLDYSANAFGHMPLFVVGSIAGTIVVCYLAYLLQKSKVFCYMGKNSLTYYLAHYFLISVIGFLMNNTWVVFIGSLLLTTLLVMLYNKIGANKLFKGVFSNAKSTADIGNRAGI